MSELAHKQNNQQAQFCVCLRNFAFCACALVNQLSLSFSLCVSFSFLFLILFSFSFFFIYFCLSFILSPIILLSRSYCWQFNKKRSSTCTTTGSLGVEMQIALVLFVCWVLICWRWNGSKKSNWSVVSRIKVTQTHLISRSSSIDLILSFIFSLQQKLSDVCLSLVCWQEQYDWRLRFLSLFCLLLSCRARGSREWEKIEKKSYINICDRI